MNEYRSLAGPSPIGESHGAIYGMMPQHILPRPIPTLRTKADLLSAEQLIDQMASTVYENSDQVAAAGLGQPGAIPVQDGVGQNQSHSPPAVHLPSAHYDEAGGHHSSRQSRDAGSSHGSPPALTPPSSAVSHTSGRSPVSHHSEPHHSPVPIASMYPSLPSAGPSGFSHGGMHSTSHGGTSFDNAEQRRRYNSNMQGKAVPISPRLVDEDEMDTTEDGATTPKAAGRTNHSISTEAKSSLPGRDQDVSTSVIDPALSGAIPHSPQSVGEADESSVTSAETQAWVQNIRVIETLKLWVAHRIRHGDYESDDEEVKEEVDDSHNLYPVLKEVQASV